MADKTNEYRGKGRALVTGASGGLGGAFALEAARKGYDLILVDLPGTGLHEIGRRLARAYKLEAQCFEADLGDPEARRTIAAWVRDNRIELTLLVNNAGTGWQSGFGEAPIERLCSIVDVNIQGTMHLTYLLLPELRRQSKAVVINVASLAAFYPMPAMAVYAASKSFILSFSLAIRSELQGSGVTVSTLCPAGMITNRDTADQVAAQGFFGRLTTMYPEAVAAVALRQALRGRDVIIPGLVNRAIRLVSTLAPRGLVVRVIGGRWKKAEETVKAQRTLEIARMSAL